MVVLTGILTWSFPKERGYLESLIPYYCATDLTVQEAMDRAYVDLLESFSRFETIAANLSALDKVGHIPAADIEKFVLTCKTMITGNNTWRYE
jgi:hypothetical protein